CEEPADRARLLHHGRRRHHHAGRVVPKTVVTRRLLLHAVGWALAGGLIALLTRAMFGLTVAQALAFAMPLGLLAVPVSLSAWYLCRAMPLSRTAIWWVAVSAIAAAVVASSLWAAAGEWWWTALGRLDLPP